MIQFVLHDASVKPADPSFDVATELVLAGILDGGKSRDEAIHIGK